MLRFLRVKNLKVCGLMGLNDVAMQVSKTALELDKELLGASEAHGQEISKLKTEDKIEQKQEFFKQNCAIFTRFRKIRF